MESKLQKIHPLRVIVKKAALNHIFNDQMSGVGPKLYSGLDIKTKGSMDVEEESFLAVLRETAPLLFRLLPVV